jgi:histidine triad (HIT) family protein
MAERTLFEKIADGDIDADIVYEDDQCIAFHDINPQAPVHVLIVPRKPIATVNDITPDDEPLVGHLYTVAKKLAHELDVAEEGYRLVMNCGDQAGQSVYHIHLHLLGGRSMQWPPG